MSSANCTIYTPGIGTQSLAVFSPLGRIHLDLHQPLPGMSQVIIFLVCLNQSLSGIYTTDHFLVYMSNWTLFGIFDSDYIRHVYNQWPFGRNLTNNCMEIPQSIAISF